MQLFQSLAELKTHEVSPQVDDLPKALEFYGARIGRDLGRLLELTGGKITVGFIVEVATQYEYFLKNTPEDIPERSPSDIFEKDLIPYMNSLLEVQEVGDDFDVATISE